MIKHCCVCFLMLISALVWAKDSKPPAAPNETAEFHFIGVRYTAGYIIARDPSGKKWPNAFYGSRDDTLRGKAQLSNGKLQGAFKLECDKLVQGKGEQDLKVLGELLKSAPGVRVALEVRALNNDSGAVVLKVGEKSIAMTVPFQIRYLREKDGTKLLGVQLRASATAKASEVGLKAPDAPSEVGFDILINGWVESYVLSKTENASLKELQQVYP